MKCLYIRLICAFFLFSLNFLTAQKKNSAPVIVSNSPTAFIDGFSKTSTTGKGSAPMTIRLSTSKTVELNLNVKNQQKRTTSFIGSAGKKKDASFSFTYTNGKLKGHIIEKNENRAYRLFTNKANKVLVEETDINSILCVSFNKAKGTQAAQKKSSGIASKSSLTKLQSRPGAPAVIYLDFDGETVSGTSWKKGGTITAKPSGLSDAEMTITWEIMAEDFSPFDINVVTDRSVFEATPKDRRMMCIFTPTDEAEPGAGGVAYLDSFSWNTDDPAWVFNVFNGKDAGDSGSHEIGHTMGLGHDGKGSKEYYEGHGNWAPIMGLSVNEPVAQWSFGEYTDATNTQNDLEIIGDGSNNFSYINDDHGNNLNTESSLVVDTNGNVSGAANTGIIHKRDDIDMFFFLAQAGSATFNFSPNGVQPNLNIQARLLDAKGVEITSSNPLGLNASITSNLSEGLYFLEVQGVGEGTVNNGYSDYASLGQYSISGQYKAKTSKDDLRLVSITPQNGNLECGSIAPSIEVMNNGLNTISGFDILYRLDNGRQKTQSFSNTLAPKETLTVNLPDITLTTTGNSTIEIIAKITHDDLPNNNTIVHNFFANVSGVASKVNSFETSGDVFISNFQSDGSVWQRGKPSGTLLNSAASGTNAYGTVLNGNYPDKKKGYLITNCYDFSSIKAPVLKFQMAYDTETNFDILYVEYSLDTGKNWILLGSNTSKPNWYNSGKTRSSTTCPNCLGGQWSGTNTTVTEYAYDFTANAASETNLTNASNIMFRFVFHSDESFNKEGVVIDDFVIEGGSTNNNDDDDNDGILNVNDNCQLISNADQLDTDNDTIGDVCDDDDDNDGILDVNDNCPLTANADQADSDGDGIGDVCDSDDDNDGVLDVVDNCSLTANADQADSNNNGIGDICETAGDRFTLPASNYTFTNVPSCTVNKGSIKIDAVENYRYQATLSGSASGISKDFTNSVLFEDLDAGMYSVCITVDGKSNYKGCFDVTIEPSEAFSVQTAVDYAKLEVTLTLTGSKMYELTLNQEKRMISKNKITLDLTEPINNLQINSGRDCDTAYKETFVINPKVAIYPNPIEGDELAINLEGGIETELTVSLFALRGSRVSSKLYKVVDNKVIINVSGLAKGIYILNVSTFNKTTTHKIIRN